MSSSGESVFELFVYTVGTVLDNLLLGHLVCLNALFQTKENIHLGIGKSN